VEQVERKLAGEKVADKIVSYYEEHTRALPKGKISKPCEFGVKLRIDMSGNGYITRYELYKGNYADVNAGRCGRAPCRNIQRGVQRRSDGQDFL